MILSSTIDEIREKADLISIISQYVPLKKRGKNYVGLCPFHSERTPSFTVSPEKKLFHCFGCGEGGGIFAFIQKIENIDFIEAVEMLGASLGIEVKKTETRKEGKTEKEKLYDIISTASKFYEANLKEAEIGRLARDYIKKRGIDERTSEVFKLGYAREEWDTLSKYLIGRGYLPSDLEKAGVSIARLEGGGYYDRFRGRLMFTISDHRGREIGFGGRVLKDEEPKYINSPESKIYYKGEILYGLNLTKDEIKKLKGAILVEGYMDLIACFQFGIKNVVSSLGTALTTNQAKMIQRYCSNVILAFDSDSAGSSATEKSIELLRGIGLNVKVALMSEEKDPDEVIRKAGAETFIKNVSKAKPWIEFKIDSALGPLNLSEIESRARGASEVASILSKEKDKILQREYIKMAAEKLKMDAETIASEVGRQSYYKGSKGAQLRKITERPTPKIISAEECLLRLAIEESDARGTLKENISFEEFTDKNHKAIAELLLSVDIDSTKDAAQFLMKNLENDETKKILSSILLTDEAIIDKEKTIKDCINTIKSHHLKLKMDSLRAQINEAEKLHNIEHLEELNKDYSKSVELFRTLQN